MKDPSEESDPPHPPDEESVYSTPTMAPGSLIPAGAIITTGRFEMLGKIGAGGMGQVYRAFDPSLQRQVALKLILYENPELVQRLLQEARAQAKISHENVCRVYEVGSADGKPYIAMELIEGTTLIEAAKEMNLDQKLSVMKQVSEGVHAAHRQSLIHRDIKPSNIMVARNEDGTWKPHVMDFGLARDTGDAHATATGVIMGTPHYMSPEQARGETHSLDRRTDVYGLGATMYAVLAGNPPFEGKSAVDVLRKVVEQEPPLLRKLDPRIPQDVETIVHKCMEKEPQHRYESARAVAEDIQRYLDGETILASRSSLFQRLSKKARKHKQASALIALASILILGLIAGLIRTQWRARERERAAQLFGLQTKEMEWILQRSYLLPLHDISSDRALVQQRMKEIEQQMQHLPESARSSGFYALGRASMALRKYEEARSNLEAAWNLGYRESEAALSFCETLLNLYQQQMTAAYRIDDEALRKARLAEIDKAYRLPALSYLQKVHGTNNAEASYLNALEAYLNRDFDRATTEAISASKKSPWLYDALILAADSYYSRGMEKKNSGKVEESVDLYRKSEELYRRATRIGESDPAGYQKLCWLESEVMNTNLYHFPDQLEASFQVVIDSCAQTFQADPRNVEAFEAVATAHWQRANLEARLGRSPEKDVQAAVDAADKAVAIEPNNEWPYLRKGLALDVYAMYLKDTGKDPRTQINQAVAAYKKALTLNPNFFRAYKNLGLVRCILADYQLRHGEDPQASFQDAETNLLAALKINPRFEQIYSNLGHLYSLMGIYQLRKGIDPRDVIRKCFQSTESSMKINPRFIHNFDNGSEANSTLASYAFLTGEDPCPYVAIVEDSYERSLQVNPEFPQIHIPVAKVHMTEALYEMEHNRSPEKALRRIQELTDRFVQMSPEYSNAWDLQGKWKLLEAEWQESSGRFVPALYDQAEASFQKATTLNTDDADMALSHARLCWRKSLAISRRHGDFAALVENGLHWIETAKKIDPLNAEALALQASLMRLAGNPMEADRLMATALQQNPLLKKLYSVPLW